MGGALIAGGFASLGRAHGTITIDTSDFRRAAGDARQFGGIAEGVFRSLDDTIDGTFRVLPTRFQQLNNAIRQTQVQLIALSATSGLLLRETTRTAGSLEESQILLEGMVGSTRRAVNLMDELRRQASRAGLPFSDMVAVATQLLPTLQGNTSELEKWFEIVRRTASLNQGPRGGLEGAAFSIREALVSGGTDLISLAERFNISRHQVREALAQTGGDLAAALDIVLTRMGVTSTTADRMGQTFNASLRVARDAALQLLAEGLTPILHVLTPILQGTAQWLNNLREMDPIMGNAAAAMLTFTAAAAPALLIINQIASAVETLKRLGLLSGLLKLGGRGILAGAVTFGTVAAANQVGQATGNKELQDVSVTSVVQTLGKVLYNIQYYTLTWGAQIDKFVLNMVATLNEGFVKVYNGLIAFAQFMQSFVPDWLDRGGWQKEIDRLTEQRDKVQEIATGQRDLGNDLVDVVEDFQIGLYNKIAAALGEEPIGVGSELGLRKIGLPAPRFSDLSEDQFNEIQRWGLGVQQIERQANAARLAATQSYELQRTQIIAQYELSIARDAEDFARQRSRAAAQYNREIASLREDAARRETEWWEDLQESIADLQEESDERVEEAREDSSERIQEIEERYAREREQALLDHRDRLLEAAAKLDAGAVLQEQRRFARESQNREQNYRESLADEDEKLQERLQKEQESLQERINEEREAHAERVQEAREADARRLQEMQEAFELQRAQEEEDRAIRLARQAEDHELQLAQMAAAHAAQIAQINQQEADELKAHNDAHIARMLELGIQNKSLEAIQKGSQDRIVEAWKKFWEDLEKEFPDRLFGPEERPPGWSPGGGGMQQGPITPGDPRFPTTFEPQEFATGGPVGYTGLARVHRGEHVLNPETTRTLNNMLGGFSQNSLVAAVARGGAGSRSLRIDTGAIQVYAAAGMDERKVARFVGIELERILESVA